MTAELAIVVLTAAGASVARRVRDACIARDVTAPDGSARGGAASSPVRIHGLAGRVAPPTADVSFADTASHLRTLYRSGCDIVGICAAGILIRALAPVIADGTVQKSAGGAVVALSADGAVAVPLLGGHQGGANRLALTLSAALGGTAAITTASDARLGVALDVPPPGVTLANPHDYKAFVAAALGGRAIRCERDAGLAPGWPEDELQAGNDSAGAERDALRIVSTVRQAEGDAHTLVYHPRALALGVGCERDTDPQELHELVTGTLARHDLSAAGIAAVYSIDLKADEAAVLELGDRLGVPVRFFTAAALERETPRLANPSAVVFREVGCHGVAEGAALAAAGRDATLVVAKHKSARATCALALAPLVVDPARSGRARGQLSVVGVGPGAGAHRTPAATTAIESADHVIGYGLYLDLVAECLRGQTQHRYRLGEESDRVRHAIELAASGARVALVCSGDAGVYAMASLACELLEAEADPARQRIGLDIVPGISAMQMAAARSGAPLGHDFCAISLSDLLTPRAAIEQRLHAAGDGDFVIALYNPISRQRVATFERALAILRTHRSPDTVVVVARNLGRADERVRTLTLAALGPDDVDMLSVVLVGSSNTRAFVHAARTRSYTPRGYHAPASIRSRGS